MEQQYSYNRPVTQGQFFMSPITKYSPIFDPLLKNTLPSSLYGYEGGDKRPLTISSGKPIYNRSSYCGNLRGPIKIKSKPINGVQYLPNKSSGQKFVMGGVSTDAFSGSSITRDRKFPSELKFELKNQRREVDNGWQKYNRNVTTAESGRNFKDYPKLLLPKLEGEKIIPEEHKQSARKTSPFDQSSLGTHLGTSDVNKRTKLKSQQCGIIGGRRPESRYNKETLYTKLDHGRAASPEYKVPILDMNFAEVANQQIIPDCWKQDK